jgi:hypothetical protein
VGFGRLGDDRKNLLDYLRVQSRPAVEWNCNPEPVFALNPVTILRAKKFKAGEEQLLFGLGGSPPWQFRHSLRRRLLESRGSGVRPARQPATFQDKARRLP